MNQPKKTEELLTKDFVIEQAKLSHSWLLNTIFNEELNQDIANHSDELKHARLVQEMLEMF